MLANLDPARLLVVLLTTIPLAAQPTSLLLDGTQAGQALGSAVAIVDDVDGDGFRDIAVGSKLWATSSAGPVGRVALHSGADFSFLWATNGDVALGEFGAALARAGDVDGDGLSEIVVGAPGTNGGDGRAVLLAGNDGRILWTRDGSSGARFGFSVAWADDQDGDGTEDVIVGAPFFSDNLTNRGIARILDGNDGSQIAQFRGARVGDIMGFAVRDAGQIIGDATTDLVIGAPFANPGQSAALGRIILVEGGTTNVMMNVWGLNSGQQFGSALERVPDLDGDGADDLLVGAPSDDGVFNDTGIVYLISGASGSVITTWSGQQDGEALGTTVAHLGPRNFDTLDEFVLGGPGFDDGLGPGQGRVVVINAATRTEIIEIFGSSAGGRFGEAISRGALLDGDSRADFVVGAPQHQVGSLATNAGQAVVYHTPHWSRYAVPAPANTLDLRLSGGVSLGAPTMISVTGAPPGADGLLAYALRPDQISYSGGVSGQGVILVSIDPNQLLLEGLRFDTLGETSLLRPVPIVPGIAGGALYLQAGAFSAGGNGFEWSNGIEIRFGW